MIAEDTDYNNILDADIADPPIVGFAETPHIVDSVFSIFASADLYVDGASRGLTDTGSTGTNLGTFTEPFAVGQNGQTSFGPSNNYGHIVELLVYPGIVSAPNRLAIRQNMATYYGITLL